MAKKKFKIDHHEYGKQGEQFVEAWLTKLGYTVFAPVGQYAADLMIEIRGKMYPLEVERRYASSWKSGAFPYDDYNLPERRYKKLRKGMLIVLPQDMDRALVVYPSSLADALKFNRFQKKSSVHAKDENILEIPVDLCRDICTNTKGVKIGREEEF